MKSRSPSCSDHLAVWMECEFPWKSLVTAFATESSFSPSLNGWWMSYGLISETGHQSFP